MPRLSIFLSISPLLSPPFSSFFLFYFHGRPATFLSVLRFVSLGIPSGVGRWLISRSLSIRVSPPVCRPRLSRFGVLFANLVICVTAIVCQGQRFWLYGLDVFHHFFYRYVSWSRLTYGIEPFSHHFFFLLLTETRSLNNLELSEVKRNVNWVRIDLITAHETFAAFICVPICSSISLRSP